MKMMHIRIFPLFYVMILVAVFVFNEDKHRGRRNLRSMCPPGLDYCHEQKKERLEETEAASRAQDEAKERRIEALEAKKVAAAQQAAVAAQRREATEREAEKLMAKTMREFHGSRRRAKKNGISGLYDEARALVYVSLFKTSISNAASLFLLGSERVSGRSRSG